MHIPFCKKACSYCNFHFSTSMVLYDRMIEAIKKEIIIGQNCNDEIETIYYGGGTPHY